MQVTPTVRNVYLYAVCFATLLMMMVGLVQVADGVFGLLYPPPADTQVSYLSKEPPAGVEAEKWEEQTKAELEAQQQREHYYQMRRVVENAILFVVALPVYWYHWRRIEKDREEKN